jgi:AcrR family transcriptional regulator
VFKAAMDDPSTRILESATRHFGDLGFEDASLRTIAGDARVNPALINYYFRSKDDLFREVVLRSVKQLAEVRIDTLDRLEAEAAGAPIPVEVLLAATAGPIFAASRAPDSARRAYVRFIARLFTHPGPETVAVVFGALTELRERLLAALRRSLPHVPAKELAWRYLFLSGSVHFTAAQIGYIEVISGGECDSADLDQALAHFIRAQAAMLSAPPSGAADRRLARKYQRLVAAASAAAPATRATAAPTPAAHGRPARATHPRGKKGAPR